MIAQLALLAALQQSSPTAPADRSYLLLVASAGTDEVALVRFGPKGMLVEHHTPFHLIPGDPATPTEVYAVPRFLFDTLPVVFDSSLQLSSAHGFASAALSSGPHQLTTGPDGRSYFVTTDRGLPTGELLMVRIARDSGMSFQPTDTIQGREPLGRGLGAASITPDGAFAWTTVSSGVGATPGGVAVVYVASMVEVAMIPTCAGPAGGQLTADGQRHYSLCIGTDQLVEIDAAKMSLRRMLSLTGTGQGRCAPDAMAMTPDGARIYVACRALNLVTEVDGSSWTATRRLAAGGGPTALALAPDGRTLVVANEAARTVALIDLSPGAAATGVSAPVTVGAGAWFAYVKAPGATGAAPRTDVYEIGPMIVAATGLGSPIAGTAALATIAGAPTAVTVSPDGKYAFISATRPGGLGTIEVVDLTTRTVAALHPFGRNLAGIAFWKVSP